MKPLRYTVTNSYEIEKLIIQCEQLMKDGWIPQGGLVIKSILPVTYYQAFINYTAGLAKS